MDKGDATSPESAIAVATDHADRNGMKVDVSAVKETSSGWYFPWLWSGLPEAGSSGIVVNKETGRVLALGSAFSVDRDLRFYDKGYQAEIYDLVVLAINDIDRAVEHLLNIGPATITPEFESGTVWRIPRRLTEDEICDQIALLPHVFPAINLYPRLEVFDEVEKDGSFEFRAIPRFE